MTIKIYKSENYQENIGINDDTSKVITKNNDKIYILIVLFSSTSFHDLDNQSLFPNPAVVSFLLSCGFNPHARYCIINTMQWVILITFFCKFELMKSRVGLLIGCSVIIS